MRDTGRSYEVHVHGRTSIVITGVTRVGLTKSGWVVFFRSGKVLARFAQNALIGYQVLGNPETA